MTWQTLGGTGADPRAWAKSLRDRERAGEKLTLYQAQAWREALRVTEVKREDAGRPS